MKVHPKIEGDKREEDAFEADDSVSQDRGVFAWVKTHPRWSTGIFLLLAAVVVVVAITVPVCTVMGCPRKENTPPKVELSPGAPRLLVNYLNKSINALDLIPPILQSYVSNLILNSSAIQILNFNTESILQEALQFLTNEQSLNFITRDFNMSNYFPNITDYNASFSNITASAQNSALQTILNEIQDAAAAGGFRRSLMQSAQINDPFYVNGSQYYVDLVNASGAWKVTAGSTSVVVAIIDSGLDLKHPDLLPNLWINTKEIPGNGIDDDNNGYIDDIYGYNFAGQCSQYNSFGQCVACNGTSMPWGDSSVDPAYFHGTHVSGIAGGVQNNGIGITGISPGIRLMILRVSDCISGNIASSTVFQAFDYALQNGAHVVSCSFAPSTYSYGFYALSPAPSYHAAWTSAYVTAMQPLAAKGILAVVAAGNDDMDLDALQTWGWSYCPCLVNMPNVLCVGGTDALNQPAFFSNYGKNTVHLGSPAMQVYSTLYANNSGVISHTYGPLNGTSMATPIVTGSAAMTLSLLGASNGNFYQAVQAKSLLMSSATLPSVPLPFISQSRVNPGLSMLQTTAQLKSVLTAQSPLYTASSGLPPTSLSFQGMLESYYVTAGNQFYGTLAGSPVDISLRNVSSPSYPTNFSSFKYSSGYIVSFTALVQYNVTGVWGIQVSTTANSLTTWVYINGQNVPLNSTTQFGVFTAKSVGWYSFELRIAYPQNNVRYALLMKSPRATTYSSYYDFLANASSIFQMPDYTQNAQLSGVWQAFYNKVNTTSSPLTISSVPQSTPTSQYQYTTTVTDPIQAISGNLASLFFPGDSTATESSTAAVGFMTTYLLPIPNTWTSPITFSVTCGGCQLLVDGVVVIDIYEPILINQAGTVLTKSSPCLTLTNNAPHQLLLRFALSAISQSTMSIQYASCAASVKAPSLLPVRLIIYNPFVWQPETAATYGYAAFIGGLQCDVYLNSNSNNNQTLSFSAQQIRPIYKFRLPSCGSDETINATCGGTWSFSLESVLTGLNSGTPAGVTYGVRCWTTWNQGFTNGLIAVTPTAANPVAYLGGIQIYGSGGSNLAPSTTLLGNMYQMLVVDWFNVTYSDNLVVTNNQVVVPINLITMRLPITGLAGASGNDLMNGSAVVGAFGACSITAYPASNDIKKLTTNNLTAAIAAMGTPLPSAYNGVSGLDTSYAYPRISGSKARYTQAEGYYFTYSTGAQTIQVVENAASSTMIVMGNVTVRNAPIPFSLKSSSSSSSFQVYYPAYFNLYTNVITKTGSPDGKTYFNFTTLNEGPWSSFYWACTIFGSTLNG
ncbi:hypothetical protein CEUSTIGMA_g10831.t1 [Chlamydomonas eustigma]|uniref:Peptidase S8/S53 domain-containing protein n=1 Tax=Chlamydomonas eustigma TaxID=1157962 RepID=A0A250XK61_9CHLO|nr:hypothetical protein CEUSTIGMA_g10831.t1 [Chlamydomonas eustigma]|eukprot:GAX83406.1 hypothetical protein CEUSTIGMA_g10831.t1 [Chlamydomonas eustigma]